MPKKTPVVKQRQWLDDYENGKSVSAIAKQSRRDVRTVNKAIDQARRQRDAGLARAELVKDALTRHQAGLLGAIDEIISGLRVPPVNLAPLPWQGTGGVIQVLEAATNGDWQSKTPAVDVALAVEEKPEWGLLQEHLGRDPLWKMLAQYKKALATYWEAQTAFQVKTVSLLGERTGCRLVESKGSVDPPFVYVDTTGPLFYEVTSRRVVGLPDGTNPEGRIVVDHSTGEVRHGIGVTLARAPRKEEQCKEGLLEVLRQLKESPEASDLVKKYKALQDSTTQARAVAEDLRLLELVPGQCRICKRLGL